MLRFSDTARRELRSDTSLLRGDRDKPAENSYLEQCQQAKLPRSFWAAAALREQEYLMWAGPPGADTQQGSPAESRFAPGVFSLHCSGWGPGTAGTDLLSHRCSFHKSLVAAHGVQLCWPSKVRLQQLPPGADTSCKTRGERGKWGEEGNAKH